jgi:type VI secretion system protein
LGSSLAVLLLALLVVAGCSTPTVFTRALRITVVPQANDDSPIAVDLVLAYSDPALVRVLATPAADWFEHRNEVLATYPAEVKVLSFEVVPGQSMMQTVLPADADRAKGAVVLARYHKSSAQREIVSAIPAVLVQLGRETMTVRPGLIDRETGDWR